jgi:hypothetical protein
MELHPRLGSKGASQAKTEAAEAAAGDPPVAIGRAAVPRAVAPGATA